MSQAKVKKAAMFIGAVLLAQLAVNTLAKRFPAAANIKQTVDNGL